MTLTGKVDTESNRAGPEPQLDRSRTPEMNPHSHGQLIFNKGSKKIPWRRDGLFNK